METISLDLRTRIMIDSDSGMTDSDVAAKHIVSVSFVKKLKRQRRLVGSIAPLERRTDGQRRKLAGCAEPLTLPSPLGNLLRRRGEGTIFLDRFVGSFRGRAHHPEHSARGLTAHLPC